MAGRPHTVTIEGRRSLQLDIQVRLRVTFCPRKYPCLTSNLFPQRDPVHTIQDALGHISRPRFVQVGPSGLSTGEVEVNPASHGSR
jgi:hypothetical protein